MIKIEDMELEEMVLSGNSCIAVPFEIYVPTDAEPQITVYSRYLSLANDFADLFGNDPLSTNALKWLDDRLYTDVKEFGYVHVEDDIHWLCEYEITKLSLLCKSNANNVKLISRDDELKGLDTSLVDDIYIDDVAAVVVRDNKVVSVTCANDVSFEDNSIELFVETDAIYRSQGLGSATVSALADYYLKKGRIVRYKCAKNNIASINLANKCGFEKVGERYSYVCYANEEDFSDNEI